MTFYQNTPFVSNLVAVTFSSSFVFEKLTLRGKRAAGDQRVNVRMPVQQLRRLVEILVSAVVLRSHRCGTCRGFGHIFARNVAKPVFSGF